MINASNSIYGLNSHYIFKTAECRCHLLKTLVDKFVAV